MKFGEALHQLKGEGNLRSVPADRAGLPIVDLSTNDYLGFGNLRLADFAESHRDLLMTPMTSSASRLLAATQQEYAELENMLSTLYGGRSCLLFNSGYHANVGTVSALSDRSTLIIADKLVHASIIDGMILSKAKFQRFRHNDFDELERMITAAPETFERIIVVVESIYSMDGDGADLERLITIKRKHDRVMLYVDEAHAFGVAGPQGLGLTMATSQPEAFDVVIATLGKALASFGAFVISSKEIREWLVNRSRPFIFSTSLPPLQIVWSRLMIEKMIGADAERKHLRNLSKRLHEILSRVGEPPAAVSHIQALVVGDAKRAVELSQRLYNEGFAVLPIRTPTVPAGTERLRFSLSASLDTECLDRLETVLNEIER